MEQINREINLVRDASGLGVEASIIGDDEQMRVRIIADGCGIGVIGAGPMVVAATEDGSAFYLTTHDMGDVPKNILIFFKKVKAIEDELKINESDTQESVNHLISEVFL